MPYRSPRCRIVPLADHRVSIEIDGRERLAWHYGPSYTRPFFFPLVGPSGSSLTRIGHPGAPNHDHHRSIWFAHAKVLGIDFWSENTAARIRQRNWLVYQDGDDEAVMAVLLDWHDGHDPQPLMEQELVVAVRPGENGETFLDLQSTFRPRSQSLEFAQTNFGFLAVRVAKNLSVWFGGGELTGSEGQRGEPKLFGKPAVWMDYSGPVEGGGEEGITYFDHPGNPGHPTHWHVREDGWMGASVCFQGPVETTRAEPLKLRYLLHAHQGAVSPERAIEIAARFAAEPGYDVVKATVKHQQYELRRTKL